MYSQASLDAIEMQERIYQFDSSFGHEEALHLGLKLAEAAARVPKGMAFRIILEDLTVFQYFMPGTRLLNNNWMDRKMHLVQRTHEPSLKWAILHELRGLQEPWEENEFYYAFVGGAFPIKTDGCYRGMIIVSGLPDYLDHRLLTQVLSDYLNQEFIPIPTC